MPNYFFDIDDSTRLIKDNIGLELPTLDDVEVECQRLLRDLVVEKMPVGRTVFQAIVRDEQGAVVYRGTMTIEGKRL